MVTLTAYDAVTGRVETIRSSTGAQAATMRAAQSIARLLPGFDPNTVQLSHRTNSHQATIYREGMPVEAPFADIAREAVPGFVIEIVQRIVGVKHSCAYPLKVDGSVRGGVVFHTPSRPNDAQRRTFTAIAEQLSLLLGAMLREGSALHAADGLRQSGRRYMRSDVESRQESARALHERVRTPLMMAEVALRTAEESLEVDPVAAGAALRAARERLVSVRDEAMPALEETLFPPVLGLHPDAIVRLHADRARSFADVSVEIAPALTGEVLAATSLPVRMALHTVLSHALENVGQHAQAPTVRVRLEQADTGNLILIIEDGGRGFDPVVAPRRRGLEGIEACVNLCGGTWSLRSAEGSGTTLTVHLPLA